MESSQPPPTQMPRIMQMTGFGICSMASSAPSKASAYSRARSLLLRCAGKSLMSAPAENALSPAPVRMTTRTPSSAPSRRAALRSSPHISKSMALCWPGRFSVIVPTLSATSTITLSLIDSLS